MLSCFMGVRFPETNKFLPVRNSLIVCSKCCYTPSNSFLESVPYGLLRLRVRSIVLLPLLKRGQRDRVQYSYAAHVGLKPFRARCWLWPRHPCFSKIQKYSTQTKYTHTHRQKDVRLKDTHTHTHRQKRLHAHTRTR